MLKTYEKKLNQLLDEIFLMFPQEWTLEDIAKKSGLAHSTVWRIEQRITTLPRFKTVFLLARAAKMEIELVARFPRRSFKVI